MIVSCIQTGADQLGDHVLVLTKEESQLIYHALAAFAALPENKRKKKLKALHKQMEEEIQCF
jgi:hypothetical protein